MSKKKVLSNQPPFFRIISPGVLLVFAMLWTAVLMPAVTAAPLNLLVNGDLETADAKHGDRPAGFTPGRIGKDFSEMTWATPGYKSNRAIAILTKDSSGLGYWQTVVTVKPETNYTISLFYRTRHSAAAARSGEPFYKARPGGPNLELGMVPDDPADAGQSSPWSDIGIALHPVGGLFLPLATRWSRFQHSFTTRPEQKRLVLKLRLHNSAQEVWFDRLSIVEGRSPQPGLPVDPLWARSDTTPPTVFRPSPAPNSSAIGKTPIGVRFADSGAGIDVATARIVLDGADVTDRARIVAGGLTLPPTETLAPGTHRVKVTVADLVGNPGNTLAWQFGVGKTLSNRLVAGQDSTRLNGELFFPIGIYAYSCHPGDGRFREDHLRQAADAGFNIVFNTYETRQGLDRELSAGIMGTVNITAGLKHCTSPAAATEALFRKGQGRLADHPSVVAFWADDPENVENSLATPVSETALAKIRNASLALKTRHPGLPAIFAISNLPRLKPAMPYGDILLSYRYAVPQFHPMMINGYTIATCRRLVPDKPLWFLSQAVDLGYGARFKLPQPMRPLPAEVGAMAFYSLICGINGYALYANFINAEDYPRQWSNALRIASRIRHLAGPLNAGTDVRSTRVKESPSSGSIFIRELRLAGRHTLVAVNMSAGVVPATWQFGKPVRASVLFEDREMKRASATVVDVFEPWGVHIYQWSPN